MLTTKKWICILLMLVASLLGAIWFMSEESSDYKIATITLNGEIVEVINLDDVVEAYTIEVHGETYKNVVQVENGRICVLDANCPDKLCVEQGYLSNSLQPIVCLPNHMTIVLSENINESADENANINASIDAITN